uniref:Uncharacterized protein n=1 Tax=Amphora coffeiformis TaxID=265554 RepID=A0A7S3KXG6_9STRA
MMDPFFFVLSRENLHVECNGRLPSEELRVKTSNIIIFRYNTIPPVSWCGLHDCCVENLFFFVRKRRTKKKIYLFARRVCDLRVPVDTLASFQPWPPCSFTSTSCLFEWGGLTRCDYEYDLFPVLSE